jgi:dipeptide/tripeptide permease
LIDITLRLFHRPLVYKLLSYFFSAGTELSERICVMGISMNLVTYLVGDLHISSAKSATIVTNFMGTLNLGGFLADAKLGRYFAVGIFGMITAVVSFSRQNIVHATRGSNSCSGRVN